MKFISLTKYFYQHTQEDYEKEYGRRFEAPFTVHFPIPIHQQCYCVKKHSESTRHYDVCFFRAPFLTS